MTLQLRQYQRDAIDALYAWFAENDGNPLVVIPTAGGKSLIIAQFVREALEQYPGTRILVLTHVRELISQNYAELIGFWPDAPAGIYSAGLNRRDLHARVLFAGIQSIHAKAYQLQKIDLVLVDESHLIPRTSNTTYRKFLADLQQINPYIKVVGFTATPFRLDSGLLHRGDDAVFSDIAYEVGIRELIRDGYLTPPTTRSASAQIDTTGVGTRAGEFVAQQLEAVATDPAAVNGVADEICGAGGDRKGWLVFGCGVDHCALLRDAIRERGFSCETIFADTPLPERDAIIRAFKRQEIRALSSMGVLTTGFNAKHVDLIAMARPTKSTGLYIQIVGRGTRLYPGKTDCLVLDFGGNILRHGPVDQPYVKEPGDGEGVMPEKTCETCGKKHPIAARICDACGTEFPFGSKVTTEAAQFQILSSIAPPEWVDVSGVSYRAHNKPGRPTSMCVSYACGLSQHREWVCFEHDGGARQRAISWWNRRAPDVAVPSTVAEALALVKGLRAPSKILVRPVGKFTEIVGATL